jgi:hypothetical protein
MAKSAPRRRTRSVTASAGPRSTFLVPDEVGHDGGVAAPPGEDLAQLPGGDRTLHGSRVAGVAPRALAHLVLDATSPVGEPLAFLGLGVG